MPNSRAELGDARRATHLRDAGGMRRLSNGLDYHLRCVDEAMDDLCDALWGSYKKQAPEGAVDDALISSLEDALSEDDVKHEKLRMMILALVEERRSNGGSSPPSLRLNEEAKEEIKSDPRGFLQKLKPRFLERKKKYATIAVDSAMVTSATSAATSATA